MIPVRGELRFSLGTVIIEGLKFKNSALTMTDTFDLPQNPMMSSALLYNQILPLNDHMMDCMTCHLMFSFMFLFYLSS